MTKIPKYPQHHAITKIPSTDPIKEYNTMLLPVPFSLKKNPTFPLLIPYNPPPSFLFLSTNHTWERERERDLNGRGDGKERKQQQEEEDVAF